MLAEVGPTVDDVVIAAERMLDLRREFLGVDHPVPVIDGRLIPYVNLDNAASTPALRTVAATVEEFLPFDAGVHRGTGYMSRLSTAAYEGARETVMTFVGADPDRDVVVFGKNTTEAVNHLARSMRMPLGLVVLTTMLEHHSNELPWRARTRTVRVPAQPDGALDEDALDDLLAEHAGRVALLAVSGASNVTGLVQPVHRLAEKVHAVGGRILVDAAQARGGEQRGAPGMVRVSLGASNDVADVDRAVRALEWLVAGDVLGTYRMLDDGTFVAEGYDEPLLFDIRPDPPAPAPGWRRPPDRRVPAGV